MNVLLNNNSAIACTKSEFRKRLTLSRVVQPFFPYNQKFYRVINEVPTVLMILIVVLVVVKPFS